MTDALETVDEIERLSLEAFILRLNMLRLVSLLPDSGGFVRDEIEAADEAGRAPPFSGVWGGDVD